MGRQPKVNHERLAAEEKASIDRGKPCGFEDKPCVRKCIYFNTCTRNPYRYDQKGVQP